MVFNLFRKKKIAIECDARYYDCMCMTGGFFSDCLESDRIIFFL